MNSLCTLLKLSSLTIIVPAPDLCNSLPSVSTRKQIPKRLSRNLTVKDSVHHPFEHDLLLLAKVVILEGRVKSVS